MFAAAFAASGLDGWRYQRLPVPPHLFEETTRALGAAGLRGANVTLPHKEAALALAGEATERARAIGAANTLTFADGRIRADNTDAPGLVAAIGPVDGKSALVLGAGGSARAAVWALLHAGARDVMVWNRTPARAEALSADLGGRAVMEPEPADLLVNCTSVGLDASDETFKELPIRADGIGNYCALVDLVYGESTTTLTRAATESGLKTVEGLEILVRQGALSLERWTGRQAPIETMRRAARRPSPR
jgi:shikimate dehydrogenase